MSVKINGKIVSGFTMRMVHGPSGMTLETDPPVDNGGEGKSFSPTDLAATAYGSCVMSIIAIAAKKDHLDLNGMKIDVEKHMAQNPRRISQLDVTLTLPQHLTEAQKAKLVEAGKNCPVAMSLHPDIQINFSVV